MNELPNCKFLIEAIILLCRSRKAFYAEPLKMYLPSILTSIISSLESLIGWIYESPMEGSAKLFNEPFFNDSLESILLNLEKTLDNNKDARNIYFCTRLETFVVVLKVKLTEKQDA